MNWEAVGAVAEAFGVILVLVTLAYLAIQVKDAKDQIRRSVQQNRQSTLRNLHLVTAQNPELAAVISKTDSVWAPHIESEEMLFEAAGLSPQEAIVWQSYHRAWWTHWSEVVENRDQLSKSHLAIAERGIHTLFSKTSAKVYLNSMGSATSPTILYVKSILKAT
jgi:hypothetical protein